MKTKWGIGRIKSLRKRLGLSQEGLARELGMSFANINRWENGKQEPSPLACKALDALEQGAGR